MDRLLEQLSVSERLNSKIDKIDEKLGRIDKIDQQLEVLNGESKKEIKELKEENKNLCGDLRSKEKKIDEKDSEIKTLREEMNDLREKKEEEINNLRAKKEQEINDLRTEKETLYTEKEKLTNENHRYREIQLNAQRKGKFMEDYEVGPYLYDKFGEIESIRLRKMRDTPKSTDFILDFDCGEISGVLDCKNKNETEKKQMHGNDVAKLVRDIHELEAKGKKVAFGILVYHDLPKKYKSGICDMKYVDDFVSNIVGFDKDLIIVCTLEKLECVVYTLMMRFRRKENICPKTDYDVLSKAYQIVTEYNKLFQTFFASFSVDGLKEWSTNLAGLIASLQHLCSVQSDEDANLIELKREMLNTLGFHKAPMQKKPSMFTTNGNATFQSLKATQKKRKKNEALGMVTESDDMKDDLSEFEENKF